MYEGVRGNNGTQRDVFQNRMGEGGRRGQGEGIVGVGEDCLHVVMGAGGQGCGRWGRQQSALPACDGKGSNHMPMQQTASTTAMPGDTYHQHVPFTPHLYSYPASHQRTA